ncbi:MAG: RDD family protein [Anaerolineae bacterium]|nr:RDD family protein [Anaerolineae bacterium]
MHRLSAVVVDFVIVDLIATPIIAAMRGLAVTPAMTFTLTAAVIGGLTAAYLLGFWSKRGQTPGMMSVGLRLVDAGGSIPSIGQAVGRLLISLLPIPGLSLIWAHPTLGAAPLQDRLTRTTMVRV